LKGHEVASVGCSGYGVEYSIELTFYIIVVRNTKPWSPYSCSPTPSTTLGAGLKTKNVLGVGHPREFSDQKCLTWATRPKPNLFNEIGVSMVETEFQFLQIKENRFLKIP